MVGYERPCIAGRLGLWRPFSEPFKKIVMITWWSTPGRSNLTDLSLKTQ